MTLAERFHVNPDVYLIEKNIIQVLTLIHLLNTQDEPEAHDPILEAQKRNEAYLRSMN